MRGVWRFGPSQVWLVLSAALSAARQGKKRAQRSQACLLATKDRGHRDSGGAWPQPSQQPLDLGGAIKHKN